MRAFTGETAYSNRDACGPETPLRDPCYAWQRADTFIAVPGQDYDDLVLTGSGTQPPPEIRHSEAREDRPRPRQAKAGAASRARGDPLHQRGTPALP